MKNGAKRDPKSHNEKMKNFRDRKTADDPYWDSKKSGAEDK